MEKEKIKFKPLHDGMGFHPFSDGLPYAPESKTKYSQGSGAVSGGRPQFATPQTALSPGVAKATARQMQERAQASAQIQTPVTHFPLTQNPTIQKHAPIAQANVVQATTAPELEAVVDHTSLARKRVFAYLMDTVIHAGFWMATNLAALFFFKFQIDSEILKDNFGQFLVFFLISQWLFIALQEILFETSIGKAFFNLEFKRNHKSLFLRSFVFMIGVLTFGIGLYLMPQDKLGQIQLKSKLYA